MTPQLCPTCREPITIALAASDLQTVHLSAKPLTTARGNDCRVVVNGYAWPPVVIAAAIAIETSVSPGAALTRAFAELDWHLPHICAGKAPVPA